MEKKTKLVLSNVVCTNVQLCPGPINAGKTQLRHYGVPTLIVDLLLRS
jgi:hypothetical protein